MRTRILLNGYDVDLIDEISMPLNFAIADIRNPEKRNTSFSKTLTIPGTSVNNDLFGMLLTSQLMSIQVVVSIQTCLSIRIRKQMS